MTLSTARLVRAASDLRRSFLPRTTPPPSDLRRAESEERYQAVIENASDMIQSVRPDGTFEFANRSWKTTLDYTDDDLPRMTIWDVIHPGSVEHCMIDFMRAIRGETVEYLETNFVAKDGRTVPVEGSRHVEIPRRRGRGHARFLPRHHRAPSGPRTRGARRSPRA